ncbi:MAG: cache domain-containing protein [Clostridia bacterium]|nr:cache domain-containing protein [Clostridia bacterium]
MFFALQRNFKFRIAVAIMSVITIPFVSLYVSFKILLTGDYSANSEKFHRQMAQTADIKLTQIENSVRMYAFKYHLGNAAAGNISFSNNDLKNAANYCPDISSSLVFDNGGTPRYYNSNHALTTFNRLVSDSVFRRYLLSKEAVWFSAYTPDEFGRKKLFWFYNTPIYSEKNIQTGYFTVLINNEKFNTFFKVPNTDYCRNDSFFLYSENGDKSISDKSKASIYPLSPKHMSLAVSSTGSYINGIMFKLFLLLAVIWAVLLVVCIFLSSKITNIFVFDLRKLCKKINAYTDCIKVRDEKL